MEDMARELFSFEVQRLRSLRGWSLATLVNWDNFILTIVFRIVRYVCVCVWVRACVRACVSACVRVCVCVCLHAYKCACSR